MQVLFGCLMAERKNMSNVKNYTEQGGDKTIIGGTLVITEDGTAEGLPTAEAQADSTASTIAALVIDFNALLAKLRTAGIMDLE
jgi:hypothetical protein